jgi:hypothetical protein
MMTRIELTRAEFEESFGFKPNPSSLGMQLYWNGANVPCAEYIFTDDALPCESPLEVAELERMYRL